MSNQQKSGVNWKKVVIFSVAVLVIVSFAISGFSLIL